MLRLLMRFLHFLFSSIAKLPLVGPHDDYEVDLLLNGSKPIGVFTDVKYAKGIIEGNSPIMDKIRADIKCCQNAVIKGKLSHYQRQTSQNNGTKKIWNFYCQIGNEDDMHLLAEQMIADEENRLPLIPIAKDYGEYLGYSSRDIYLFSKGGYEALPFGLREIFQATHNLRLKCRVASQLDKSIFELKSTPRHDKPGR